MKTVYTNGVKDCNPSFDLINEVWKDVREFVGYQVSDFGRIRCCRDNHGNLTDTYRVLDPMVDDHGYLYVTMSKFDEHPRKQYLKRINRLVAEAFIGHSPKPNMVVDHKNTNKWDNRPSNLRWKTFEENSTLAAQAGLYKTKPVRVIETGEVFDSLRECAKNLGVDPSTVSGHLTNPEKTPSIRGLHMEFLLSKKDERINIKETSFLYPHQNKAVRKMFSGCILNGGTGTGKSRTALYWFFVKNGGYINKDVYRPMNPNPPDLYIITTAKKKNDKEWEGELTPFLLYPDPKTHIVERYGNKIIIDSWQCIKKYADVRNAVFIFDEDKLTGTGAWCKAFLKIAKYNEWVILSASPGDTWSDYETVFVANGFFRNRTEFRNEHLIYSKWTNYPSVTGYRNETRLIRLRDNILIDMDFDRHTIPIDIDIPVDYDRNLYRQVMKSRFDPYKEEPIQQAAGLCYVLRRVVNTDDSRQTKLLEIFEDNPRMIVFYSFDYELDILKNLYYGEDVAIAQYNGHSHDAIPNTERWVYLVNYQACEGWNCIKTNCIVFYSQTYSYKTLLQAKGRIDRLNTPYEKLMYYHVKSKAPIDIAISQALAKKKRFNEKKFTGWDK